MASDSRIIGDYLNDIGALVGEDDIGEDELAALVGNLELGRSMRRGQARRSGRGMRRAGVSAQDLSAVRAARLRSTNQSAMTNRDQLTAGHYVADGGQRTLYLPFSTSTPVAALVNSTGRLQATVQRPMSVKRIIISALDSTTFLDALNTLGVNGISIGVQPVFNASGIAPAEAFAFNAVGNNLETMVARVGTIITMDFSRLVTVANAAVISGYMIGVSAEQ